MYDSDGNLEEEDLSKFANKKTDALLQEKMKQLGMTIEQFHVNYSSNSFLNLLIPGIIQQNQESFEQNRVLSIIISGYRSQRSGNCRS